MHHRSRGFTIIEIAIAVVIVALVAGVALPVMGHLTRAELRKSSGQLAGLLRSCYDNAALSGQTYRVIFEINSSKIHIQKAPTRLRVDPGERLLTKALDIQDDDSKEKEEKTGTWLDDVQDAAGEDVEADNAGNPLAGLLALGQNLQGAKSYKFESALDPLIFDDDIKILDVWIEGMDKPLIEGQVYLHFFPHGYTESAVIHLTDDSGRIYALVTEPLTGKVTILNHYHEADKTN